MPRMKAPPWWTWGRYSYDLWTGDWTKRPPPPKLPWWEYVILIIVALCILDMMKSGVEADAAKCNKLAAKPPFSSILTCQKTYHYQPDPFTG